MDAWGQRRHPSTYPAADLAAALVEDMVAMRPPGGPGNAGLEWMVAAVVRVAAARRVTAERAWHDLLNEVEALTGRRMVALA